MTKKKSPTMPSTKPVIYVHAKGHSPANPDQARALLELGLPVLSRLELDGVTQTTNGYDQPVQLLAELASLFPGRPVILLRAGLQPSRILLDRLTIVMDKTAQPAVLSVLSNARTSVNPFAGLHAPSQKTDVDLEGLVNLLAPGHLHTLTEWPDHFTFISADAVELITANTSQGTLIQQLVAAGGKLQAPDHLFLHDPDSRLFEKLKLQPHESACPPPFSELSARLQDWINAGISVLPVVPVDGESASLHITHSWGGGIAQWIKSFIEIDSDKSHYQLRSENTQSNKAFGQKLSLYAGNELRCPIATWWLQPAIESVADTDTAYKEILSAICNRFQIGRVSVSSLIGHSLDVLRTGLPTVQILHDHFPLWPMLGVNPEPFISGDTGADLDRALTEHKKSLNFLDKNSLEWSRIHESYVQALNEFGVKIVAPGQWVLDLQHRIYPAFAELNSKVIPHGFPALTGLQSISPKPREDGRLRMVILGRMQEGKGQKLLLSALPELAEYVQIYLLGSGKPGEAFFGIPGIDVILEYDREELGSLLSTIGPDFAALFSVVPETFSYTLSELQQLGIPAIATRVGSFPDRIVHGETGWLVDVNAAAVVKQVAALHDDPGQVESVRLNLSSITASKTLEMVKAYNRLCPPAKKVQTFIPTEADSSQMQWAAADFQDLVTGNELRFAKLELKKLAHEIKLRSEWAEKVNKDLKLEQASRKKWVGELRTEIARLTREFEAKSEWALQLDQELEQERKHHKTEISRLQIILDDTNTELGDKNARLGELEPIAEEHTLILQSTSWKITRPLRAARRAAKNFMLARAWNPLRWPWLISNMVRNLRTRGLSETLQRLQYNNTDVPSKPRAEARPNPVGEAPTSIAFQYFKNPTVSIVIPAYNKWDYTAACLHSLAEVKGKYSFEVIVVDDQSSDETAEKLAQIEGLEYLRNEKNLGFVGSCNRGARHARGEFLVLLNNDTQVVDGWLDELIGTFNLEPRAGLVGARLIYPDGSLQESGGIIFNDGSGWNYGRGDDAERPEYHFLREVDYCSGACIALRTAYFREIGGLDERYSPAYYEDTDLAFKVRESGYKVMVQPMSVIVHHEGVTSGTDTSSGTKKFQLINQRKFLDRWRSELQSQPQAISNPDDKSAVRKASQHRSKGQILFIDATTPEPDKDSGSVRLTNLLSTCRELGYGVTFFADNRAYAGKYTSTLQEAGIEVLYHPWLTSLEDFFRERGNEYDYIFISRHYVATNYVPLLKRYCPDARFIFDTVDLHYLREQRLAELENSKTLKATAQQTRRSELAVIKAADATLVVSAVEKGVLAEDAPGHKVHIVSNIHHVPGRDNGFSDRKDIYFVGGYQHPPNIDAACWFVNDVWPLIHEQLPEMRFHLIGSKAPEQVRSLQGEGVVFHGFVESLQPFLSGCRLAVAPLRYGAGVKGKVNMSMAHGQPMVVTSVAGEGLFAEHEREFLIAEDAESFAREVVRLYQDEDLWYQLSDASIENVETHFSVKAAREAILSLIESLQ